MIKILSALILVFLVMALTVFGSPFFAALFVLPALILYFALVGLGLETEEGVIGEHPREGSSEQEGSSSSHRVPSHSSSSGSARRPHP